MSSPTRSAASSPPGQDGGKTVYYTTQKGGGAESTSSRLLRGMAFKLILAGMCMGLLIVVLVSSPATYDAAWWVKAGIVHDKPHHQIAPSTKGIGSGEKKHPAGPGDAITRDGQNVDAQQHQLVENHGGENVPPVVPKKRQPLNPKNGTEYFADYDVSSIVVPGDPPLTKEHPKYLFHYANAENKEPPMKYLSAHPRVGWVPNFLTDEECDAIIAEASKTMARSQVVPYKDSKDANTVSEVRTSSQTWLQVGTNPAKPVVDRIMDYLGFPQGSSEMLQVLRYEKGEKYDAHLDYFDPKLYGPQTSNRAVTVFIYLSTVEEGGYTQFPRAEGKPPTWDFKSCVAGLKVRPIKGTIAFFYDMKPNGEYDDYSLHGGCKPVVGTKWGGTLWLRVPV